jgi:hypothetical protein
MQKRFSTSPASKSPKTRSLVPLLKGETPDDWRNSLYYHYYEFHGDRKTAHMVRRHYGVRTKRYTLINFYNLGEWELYDLVTDPHQMQSVFNHQAYLGIARQLQDEVARLQEQYKVPDDRGSVPKDPPVRK